MSDFTEFFSHIHPYDTVPAKDLESITRDFQYLEYPADKDIYHYNDPLKGLYVIRSGSVAIYDEHGAQISLLGSRNSFGERGLLHEGLALTTARTTEDTLLFLLPITAFEKLLAEYNAVGRFFDRGRSIGAPKADFLDMRIADVMVSDPLVCAPDTTIQEAASLMRDRHVSCLGIVQDQRLLGIVTTRDFSNKVVAQGLDVMRPVSSVMTINPISLSPTALGSDVLHTMFEKSIGHLPITEKGQLVGILTQTDLTRFHAVTSVQMIGDISTAADIPALAAITARIPSLLGQLVSAGNSHAVVTRRITDIADALTRRLLTMAEAKIGPPPVKYLWLACGSQGRQEQTGISDQDNCLFLDEDVRPDDMPYFQALAKYVSDGLHHCGYVYCPGDMMATNTRWCQSVHIWRRYFQGWIATPDPMAQMLASVMFDLRPIGGTASLFSPLQAETLELAARNSIFVAHMIANSLKHSPPLGLLRGLATIRSGEHKRQLDMKHNGVVPVVDLGRVYALLGRLESVNTRARLEDALIFGQGVSKRGGRDLIDAYDLIAQMRLEHQARQIRQGKPPDNYLSPSDLSDFERSHLRDAFVVISTMQSAIGSHRGAPG